MIRTILACLALSFAFLPVRLLADWLPWEVHEVRAFVYDYTQ